MSTIRNDRQTSGAVPGDHAREALQVSDECLRLAAEAARFGVYDADLIAGKLYWSAEMKSILGLDEALEPPEPGTMPSFIHPDDRKSVRAMMNAAFDPSQDGRIAHEHRIVWPDGRVRWVQVRGAVRFEVIDGARRAVRSTGFMIDITAWKDSEERERAARGEAERASSLARLFIGVLSHDLRTPLAAVQWAGETILEARDMDTAHLAATRLLRSTARMRRMIDQVLDVTRIRERGSLPCMPSALDLRAVACSVREELAESQGSMPIDSVGDTTGTWDQDRMAQVFSNLLGNAREHSAPHAVVHTEIDGSNAQRVIVKIRNPSTIPSDELANIFEPFRQGTIRQGRGLGLGLHIAKLIVAAHAGALTVTSTGHDGTCFTLELPRHAAAPLAREAPGATHEA